jgi:hypothetical protein
MEAVDTNKGFKMKCSFIFFIVFLVAGCSSSVDKIQGPNGKAAFIVECSSSSDSWSDCYNKTSDLCPSGYNFLAKDQERKGSSTDRILMVQCIDEGE